ncbi:hypothetical protein PR202_gb12267 [Eleusine coracana subsp. coracana]|uniref:Protein TIFY n=1 Tax=Eleusine coracana subsp. coracana TaxID=191504 RepID=A0AAV5EMD2_ELECO|nr:hypothetical protein QOZ80_7BG0586770 [Eleusine coracana subsp. coracana]GJN24523.1 hypothetical protein PR202_gb12267 [Eleusine coracana subsp. coracana]
MEGRRDDVTTGAAAPPQGRRYYGRRGGGGGGGSGDESDGSSSGVELSLRLRTGSSPPAAAEQHEAAARRSMTIFYDGRMCAVDVTEIQAREIISMANQEILAVQRQHQEDRHVQDRGSTSSSGGQGYPRPGLATTMATGLAGLSMKRSLQQFLQKREARRAAAVAPPYAGGGGRQAQATRH